MPVPIKGSQLINHRDTQYRWFVRSTGSFSELLVELTAVIDGQILIVQAPKVFDWKIIPKAIDWANKNGWKNAEQLPDMLCRYTRKGFIFIESEEE